MQMGIYHNCEKSHGSMGCAHALHLFSVKMHVLKNEITHLNEFLGPKCELCRLCCGMLHEYVISVFIENTFFFEKEILYSFLLSIM